VLSTLTLAGTGNQNPFKHGNAIIVTVSCKVACSLLGGGTLSISNVAKVYRLPQVKKSLAAGGKSKLTLKLSKKAIKALKKAFAKQRAAAAKIKVTAKTTGGTVAATRTVILKR
jgi:hypothetical protein